VGNLPVLKTEKEKKMKEYEMSEEQYKELIEASKPVPYLIFGGKEPISPQENANMAWRRLGNEMGFKYRTVEPSSKGKRFFKAEEAVVEVGS